MVKVGGFVKVINVEKTYVRNAVFGENDKSQIKYAMLYARLSEKRKYKVVDVCSPCKQLWIKINNGSLLLRFDEVKRA